MKTVVYKYYCEPFSDEDEGALRRDIAAGAGYRRVLMDIENNARDSVRSLEDEDDAVRFRRRKVARWHGYEGKLSKGDKDRQRVSEAVARNVAKLRAALKSRWDNEEFRARRIAIWADKAAQKRAARANCGVSWGTYQFLEEAHDLACRTVKSASDPIRTHISFDEGAVAAHIQNRILTTEDVFGDDTFVRIGKELYARSERNKSGAIRPARFMDLFVRVGTLEDRSPRWVRMRLLMHRPLPDGCIAWARVHRERTGLRYRYSAQFVVKTDEKMPVATPTGACVGVDLGWRKLDDGGIRVAFAVDKDGVKSELVIPAGVVQRREKTSDLRSIRDKHTDAIRSKLLAWREGVGDCWWREETAGMHSWKKVSHFVSLFRKWQEERVAGDDDVFDEVSRWLKQDRHLLAWEAHNDRKMRNQISGRVAQWCAAITNKYETVFVEKMAAKPIRRDGDSKKRKEEGDTHVSRLARQRGSVVAPFAMLAALKAAATKRGRTLVEAPPEYTTMDCSACGHRREQSAELEIRCSACGLVMDQDLTAAINIMARGADQKGNGEALDAMIPETSGQRKLRRRGTRKAASRPLEAGASTN